MSADSPKVTEDSGPSLASMAFPLVISFWMRAAFTVVDTAFAATLGDAEVAAIGLAVPFELIHSALWVGLSAALTSGLSQAMGAGQGARIEQYLKLTRRLIFGAIPLLACCGLAIIAFADQVGLAPEVADAFKVYGGVLITGSACTGFWSVLPDSVVKAHQDTRSTMWAGICSNVVNLSLNALFLFVFEWGIFGIALSTVLGRLGGLAYATRQARRHELARQGRGAHEDPRLDPRALRFLLSLSIPSALGFVLLANEAFVVNGILSREPNPTAALAAYSIIYRATIFFLNPIIACGVALLPFSARRFGRRDLAGLRGGLTTALGLSAAYVLGFAGPVLWLAGPTIAAAFSESAETTALATEGLALVPWLCLATAGFMLARPCFEALQRGFPNLVMAVLRYLVLTIPALLLALANREALGLDPVTAVISALICVASLCSLIFIGWLRRAQAELPERWARDDALAAKLAP